MIDEFGWRFIATQRANFYCFCEH